VLGADLSATEHTVPFGEARVWALRRDGVLLAWLKRHRGKERAARERHAYEAWVPAIGSGTAAFLGVCPKSPLWMMTEAAPGVRADRARLTPAARAATYRAIGTFLARLHALPHDDVDPVPLAATIHARAASWSARADGVVDDDLREAADALLAEPIPRLKRVPCHRDLGLHNVIVDADGDHAAITVIDFGQSQPDVWLADLVKLFQRADEVLPADHRAFFEGYGRRLTSEEARMLARLRALHGLATWVWGADHGDAAGVRVGRRVLEGALLAAAG
jgi:aminoglycoside phosphotransferase